MFSLKNKTAFITGGASGIGLAVARRYLAAGARVVIADLHDGTDIAAEIGAIYLSVDVSDSRQVAQALASAEEAVGKLDIIVNNAGITGADSVTFEQLDDSLALKTFEINTYGVMYGLKHGPKHMNDGGAIINTGSQAVYTGMPGSGPYSASKAAVVSMTKMAALELGHRGIWVNAVNPTFTQTPMLESDDVDDFIEFAGSMIPFGRIGTPEDLVGLYHFLAAAESAYITGQSIVVDGGWTAGITYASMAAAGLE